MTAQREKFLGYIFTSHIFAPQEIWFAGFGAGLSGEIGAQHRVACYTSSS